LRRQVIPATTANFHHQTNGYFSDLSANLYDLQVLVAQPMRCGGESRSVRAESFDSVTQGTVLDVACELVVPLKLLRSALPQASLFGIDLSPAYLRNQLLSQIPGSCRNSLHANAEEPPYR